MSIINRLLRPFTTLASTHRSHPSRRSTRRCSTRRPTRRLQFESLAARRVLATVVAGDFNGDGYEDMAVGAPDEDVGKIVDAGMVHVIYGGPKNGLHNLGDQFWSQATKGVRGVAEAGDRFGADLAAGDFNGDGIDDLAIGAPNEDWYKIKDAGAINVLYGSRLKGLHAFGDQVWSQATKGVLGKSEAGDLFGYSLAAGDFNGDGRDDLAIGAPHEDWYKVTDAGALNVLYGSKKGLHAFGDQVWSQSSPGIKNSAEPGDLFALSLTTGDFNGDGRDDLAVGVPGEDWNKISNSGLVNVIYGSQQRGLHSTGDQVWHQGSEGVKEKLEAHDAFGTSLAAGDFNGDGRDDLAIGVPGEDAEPLGSSAAHAANKLTGFWQQQPPDASVNGDRGQIQIQMIDDGKRVTGTMWYYGETHKIVGNKTSDGSAAVTVGGATGKVTFDYGNLQVEWMRPNGKNYVVLYPNRLPTPGNAGLVQVLYGSEKKGIQSFGDQLWHQDSEGISDKEKRESGDAFGWQLAAGDFNGDGRDDLAIAAPFESVGNVQQAGAVHVLYGARKVGLQAYGDQLWHQSSSGTKDRAETKDWFGFALAAGDFNGDGRDDLAVAVPLEELASSPANIGAIHVLYGSKGGGVRAFGDQFWSQADSTVQGTAEAEDHFGGSL